ncbi:MAG: YbaB/EbfC family nucleoid-associated protein [Alphaproteobacteria bacterium]|jgi:DNA-binding YbaB/EbfC family protein|nr:YbaB/EbfC family nucleoid-associated protein [Alphaproteobacteria bacterium]
MKNIGNMLKQAQEMQTKMAEVQERLAAMEVEGTAGAGLVTVTISGKNDIKKVKIDPSLIDPGEAEVLEDLIVAAAADAKTKVDEAMQEEMAKLTGGMQLPPGMKLPF